MAYSATTIPLDRYVSPADFDGDLEGRMALATRGEWCGLAPSVSVEAVEVV